MIGPQKVYIGFSLHTWHGPYSGPPWIRLWTTFMNGPLLNSTYGWPQTPKKFMNGPQKVLPNTLEHLHIASLKICDGPLCSL